MNAKSHPKRRGFNLIEVALAVMIVGVGASAIMGLFPVGINATRDAIGDNYAGNLAEEMMAYVNASLQSNPAAFPDLGGAIPDASTALSQYQTYTNPDSNQKYKTETLDPDDDPNARHLFGGIYQLPADSYSEIGSAPAGVYRVVSATGDGSDTIVDFDGELRLWRSDATGIYVAGFTLDTDNAYSDSDMVFDQPSERKYLTGINMEVNWPVAKPYANRSKRYYYMEVFNPSPNP